MAVGNTYTSHAQRIGAWKGRTLAYSKPQEVLATMGEMMSMRRKSSDTLICRRWLPIGGSATDPDAINRWDIDPQDHLTVEGVTPPAQQVVPHDVKVQLRQYSVLFRYTDQVRDLYEDDVVMQISTRCGEATGLVRELIRYGAIRACVNRYYGAVSTAMNAAVASGRNAVGGPFSLNTLRQISTQLMANGGETVRPPMRDRKAGNDITQVEPAYVVFCHTDMQTTIRQLSGFIHCTKYAGTKTLSKYEFGAVENFRFILSKELGAYKGVGSNTTTGLINSNSRVDVYPVLVVAMHAWADVKLNGDSFSPFHIPADKRDKMDPTGVSGFIGTKFYAAPFVQNDGWMAVIESAAQTAAA